MPSTSMNSSQASRKQPTPPSSPPQHPACLTPCVELRAFGIKVTPEKAREIFAVLDVDRSGVLSKADFLNTLKSAVKEAGDRFKKKRSTMVRKVAEVQPEVAMPFHHFQSMFRSRLKAFMMQDRTIMRDLWRKYDVHDRGILDLNQLGDLIRDCGIHVPASDAADNEDSNSGRPSERWSVEQFMASLSGGKKTMFYQDFVANILVK